VTVPCPGLAALRARAAALLPGLATALLVAVAARFVADHYGAPAMLMALLFGISLNVLSQEGRSVAGIAFASSSVLRIGVALMGFRISAGLVVALGPAVPILVAALVASTVAAGLILARPFGRGWKFGLLTGGAVAICGASAAVAIASVLPKDDRSEERLVFTVATVTAMSTLAMILYPVLAGWLALDPRGTGIFLGAAIHDVAQVTGAGFSISSEVGETATVVKLLRVAMLGPLVIALALFARGSAPGGARPPLLPPFVAGFVLAALAASTGLIPDAVVAAINGLSSWMLLTAIAAVGLRTSLAAVLRVGPDAIAIVALESLWLCLAALTGTMLIG